MTRAPQADIAVVSDEKLTGYIFNSRHKDGWPKGQFLITHGFDPADLAVVRIALLEHLASNDVAEEELTSFGVKYRVDGPLNTPSTQVWVRTVWQVDTGQTTPRFVTMVPIPRPE